MVPFTAGICLAPLVISVLCRNFTREYGPETLGRHGGVGVIPYTTQCWVVSTFCPVAPKISQGPWPLDISRETEPTQGKLCSGVTKKRRGLMWLLH